MKRWLAAAVLAAVSVPFVCAQTPQTMPAWKLKLRDRLAQRTSIAVQSTPLIEVVEVLRGALKVNIVLDADATISEKLITLDLQDTPGDTILGWVTRQAGLDYVLADEAVYISLPAQVRTAEPRATRQYDVTDVILPAGTLAARGSSGSSSGNNSNDSGNNSSSGGGFSNADAAKDLMTLIVTFTGRENWDQVAVLGISDSNSSSNDNSSKENLF